jgi:hypothetical protein
MSKTAAAILAHLMSVEDERIHRIGTPGLTEKVGAIKAYQQLRFSHTYSDLLHSNRYGAASRFFLDELYGPTDFTQRDAQFARVVPALVRLFPSEVVETVASLAALHALSESLDTAMGAQLVDRSIAGIDYVRAWQGTARRADREAQVSMTLDVARRLDRLTGRILVRNSLRLMRLPARAAGMTQLQQFLEAGFDTFGNMKGAEEFIDIVGDRERALASAMFSAVPESATDPATVHALSTLPMRKAAAPRPANAA